MNPVMSDFGIAIVAFASTNMDDIFLLAAFFSDPRLHHRSVVIGQYLGIGTLVLISTLAALLALAFPAGWVSLLGIVPLFLGFKKLLDLRMGTDNGQGDNEDSYMQNTKRGTFAQAFTVAGVTIANGGDNIGVYVPLFANSPGAVLSYTLTFSIMTGIWCTLGYFLVNNRILGSSVKRYGHIALPFVLIGLGAYILSGALVLIH